MSDPLDELANIVHPAQHQQVNTRRREQLPAPVAPAIYLTPATPQRSAFASGFFGTFGVIAALLVILLVWGVYLGIQDYQRREAETARLRQYREDLLARENAEHDEQAAQAASQQRQRERVAAAAYSAKERRAKDQQKIAAWEQAHPDPVDAKPLSVPWSPPPEPPGAAEQIAATGKVTGSTIEITLLNKSDRAVEGIEAQAWAGDGGFAPIETFKGISLRPREARRVAKDVGISGIPAVVVRIKSANFFSPTTAPAPR